MLEFSHFLGQATGDGGNTLTQIADQFHVNWPQFLSQLFLFGVVLLTLKKFAFAPVQKVLAERQSMIDQTVEDSESARLLLSSAEATRRELVKKAELKSAEIIAEAKAAAEALASRRLAEATKEAEMIVTKTQAAMVIERARMEAELRDQITRLVAEATQRVTGKILTPQDHQRLNEETLTQIARN